MHPIVPYARTAYAHGWAISAGPMTARVKAGCLAAIDVAIANAEDPQVLEVTLQLGALEGTWALIYDRREKLHTATENKILTAWRALRLGTLTDQIVKAARRRAGLGETSGDDKDWLASVVRQAVAANVTVTDVAQLRDTIHDAIITAQAEGSAAAQALRADDIATARFSFDVAFEDAYKALEGSRGLSGAAEVDAWLNRLLGDNADEVGAKLASLTRDGASYEEMTTAVGGILDGAASRGVTTAVDVLTSRAISQGSLSLYRADGLSYVDYLTAGDGRVCPRCFSLEARNPYRIEDAPLSGQHPWCRCALAPSQQALANLADAPSGGPATLATGAADAGTAGASATDAAIAGAWGTAGQYIDVATDAGLEQRIASGVAHVQPLGGGMSADTSLLTLNDGSQAVLKVAKQYAERPPKESTDAETLAAKLGQELGIRVPEAVRTADDNVYLSYVRDAETGMEKALNHRALDALADSADGRRLGLFDLVVGNTDRNDGNWLIDAEGALHGIDHGMGFQVYRSPAELAELVANRNPFAGRLLAFDHNTHRVTGGTRAYSRADIDHIRAVLGRLESDFAALGRRSWYRQTMSRLNWLAKYATDDEGKLFG